jgi:hypothetical protein
MGGRCTDVMLLFMLLDVFKISYLKILGKKTSVTQMMKVFLKMFQFFVNFCGVTDEL